MFGKAFFSFLLLAGLAVAQNFSINTPPSLIQCQPAALSWVGGTGPYILAALPGGQISAPAVGTISTSATGNTFTWVVNIAIQTITIKITDSTGLTAYTSQITIQAGTDTSCVGASASAGATATTSGATDSNAATASTAAGASTSSGASSTTSSSDSASSDGTLKSTTTSAATSTTSKASTTSSLPVSATTSTGAGQAVISPIKFPSFIIAAVGGILALF